VTTSPTRTRARGRARRPRRAVVLRGASGRHLHLQGGRRPGAAARSARCAASLAPTAARRWRPRHAHLDPGAWLLGRGWDQNRWPTPDTPRARRWTGVATGRAVALTRIDGHALWVNGSRARARGDPAKIRPIPAAAPSRATRGGATGSSSTPPWTCHGAASAADARGAPAGSSWLARGPLRAWASQRARHGHESEMAAVLAENGGGRPRSVCGCFAHAVRATDELRERLASPAQVGLYARSGEAVRRRGARLHVR